MAFKGTDALFAVKIYLHKKFQRQKGVKIRENSALNQALEGLV
jgi:hypothetical protein